MAGFDKSQRGPGGALSGTPRLVPAPAEHDSAGLSAGSGSGRLKRVLALLPVAGAQLVGLQGVQNAQDFLRVAADRQVIDRSEADDALGIDDEGGAECHAFGLVEDAELGAQLALDVGQHRERQVTQVVVVDAPGVVDELAVGRSAENLGVAVGELAVQLAESGDLGRAHEGEVLRPEEHDQPLALERTVGELGERLLRIGGNDGLEVEGGKLIANSKHETRSICCGALNSNNSKLAATP